MELSIVVDDFSFQNDFFLIIKKIIQSKNYFEICYNFFIKHLAIFFLNFR